MKSEIPAPKRPIKPEVDSTQTIDDSRKPMICDGETTVDGVIMATWKCANESLSERISNLIRDFYLGKL